MAFEGSHLWELRQLIGHRLIVVPAAVVVAVDAAMLPMSAEILRRYRRWRTTRTFDAG